MAFLMIEMCIRDRLTENPLYLDVRAHIAHSVKKAGFDACFEYSAIKADSAARSEL